MTCRPRHERHQKFILAPTNIIRIAKAIIFAKDHCRAGCAAALETIAILREGNNSGSRRVEMDEITKNDFNLNISRYISTAIGEAEIDLAANHEKLVEIESGIKTGTQKHNAFLKELGLPDLP